MSTRGWFLMVVAGWLAAGIWLKVDRLAHDQEKIASNATSKLSNFLADFGWERSVDVTASVSEVYTTLVYEKEGCASSLAVVLVGPSAESEHLIKQSFHGDVAFIQNGMFANNLEGVKHHFRYIIAPLLSLVGLSSAESWPIVAISPRPPAKADACTTPPLKAWHTLYEGHSGDGEAAQHSSNPVPTSLSW